MTIGLQQIYDAVIRLDNTVARLIDKTDSISKDHGDHESRIRALEASRWPLPTLSILVALGAFVAAFLRG